VFALRHIFPAFERPVAEPHYVHIKPRRSGLALKIAGVLVAGLACAIALTPPDTSNSSESAASPVVVASATEGAQPQKPVAVDATPTPTPEKAKPAKTAAACGQSTARKDCVAARAAKAALLEAPQETSPSSPSPVVASAVEPAANIPAITAPAAATEALAAAEPVATAAPANTPFRTAAKKKTAVAAKKPRYPDDLLVERLVRVYDRILPDGRVVSVYRRASGGYESGSITYGEYRRASAAPLDRPRYFGLQ
jgi:hypothetical protein